MRNRNFLPVLLNPRECHKINSHFILLHKKVNILNKIHRSMDWKARKRKPKQQPELRNKTIHSAIVVGACLGRMYIRCALCPIHTQFHNQRSLPVIAIS